MEAIVQNTASVASENNAFRSNIELQQNRYKILGSARDQRVRDGIYLSQNATKYTKDPEAYYPYVNPNKDTTPVVDQVKVDNPPIYQLDKKAYYNPTGEFRVIPSPYVGKTVPVNLGELQNTFPTEKNLQGLKTQLQAINMKENLDLNTVVEKGIYIPDPHAYYDPSVEDTSRVINDLKGKVAVMESDLNNNLRNNLNVDVGTVSVHQEVQNAFNKENEIKANLEKINYYTPVINNNGRSVELPVGYPIGEVVAVKQDKVMGAKEDVDVIEHKLEEAEEVQPEKKKDRNTVVEDNVTADSMSSVKTNTNKNVNLRKVGEERGKLLSTNKIQPSLSLSRVNTEVKTSEANKKFIENKNSSKK
jgi:hypothetical protein